MKKIALLSFPAVNRFTRNTEGATAIEYGLLAAAISVAIIATVFLVGDEVFQAFQTVLTQLQAG